MIGKRAPGCGASTRSLDGFGGRATAAESCRRGEKPSPCETLAQSSGLGAGKIGVGGGIENGRDVVVHRPPCLERSGLDAPKQIVVGSDCQLRHDIMVAGMQAAAAPGVIGTTCPSLVSHLYTWLMSWDPKQYQRYRDERGRPFHELVDRIVVDPATVETAVDLGCGPGQLTATLCDRWPAAQVIGLDNDANMLSSAADLASDRLSFASGTVQRWRPDAPVDVVVSNATLQWVPGHLAMLPDLLTMVRPGGWFAFQVPGNLDDPHHQEIRSLYRSQPWSDIPAVKALPDRTHGSHTVPAYLDVLAPLCSHIDGWETTYIHVLHGADPVLEWVKGTALRPVLAALQTDAARVEFLAQLAPRLRAAYPSRPWGTPFPFKRIFVVAQRAGNQTGAL